ncbi:Zn(II)-C6 fungal-type domain-containing protein [Phanerochaete sordida]|uniref:Zn(II)-C6 fungal-type domain-containing protein n=1 Tax=Phanerochaete sordida TaxID=48140 RepID=A0A9P3GGC2_9APHY|nr:Zn(II)-C6 fungal-type domain-containing protein [Phanerochaete sordida]
MSSDEIPQHLPRGKACVPCRRRKMKCDGNQPTCNQCLRFNRSAECQFSEGPSPSTTRVLEQHIARLQSRIHELEQDDPSLVRLHDPYQNFTAAAAAGSSGANSTRGASPAAQGGSRGTQANWWETPDPPPQVQQALVQVFLRDAPKFGFFLETKRFLNAFAKPTAARPRPPSVLRNTVYLWGIALSQDAQYTARETIFLGRALRSVHVALSSAHEHTQNTLYVLQAEVLLAYYFYHSNRLLEGKFHASAAVSLAVMCGLHQLHAPPGAAAAVANAYLPPAADAIDEAERVYAWWCTFVLDKTWVVALAAPSMVVETQEPSTTIHTPWPLALDEYAQATGVDAPEPRHDRAALPRVRARGGRRGLAARPRRAGRGAVRPREHARGRARKWCVLPHALRPARGADARARGRPRARQQQRAHGGRAACARRRARGPQGRAAPARARRRARRRARAQPRARARPRARGERAAAPRVHGAQRDEQGARARGREHARARRVRARGAPARRVAALRGARGDGGRGAAARAAVPAELAHGVGVVCGAARRGEVHAGDGPAGRGARAAGAEPVRRESGRAAARGVGRRCARCVIAALLHDILDEPPARSFAPRVVRRASRVGRGYARPPEVDSYSYLMHNSPGFYIIFLPGPGGHHLAYLLDIRPHIAAVL